MRYSERDNLIRPLESSGSLNLDHIIGAWIELDSVRIALCIRDEGAAAYPFCIPSCLGSRLGCIDPVGCTFKGIAAVAVCHLRCRRHLLEQRGALCEGKRAESEVLTLVALTGASVLFCCVSVVAVRCRQVSNVVYIFINRISKCIGCRSKSVAGLSVAVTKACIDFSRRYVCDNVQRAVLCITCDLFDHVATGTVGPVIQGLDEHRS